MQKKMLIVMLLILGMGTSVSKEYEIDLVSDFERNDVVIEHMKSVSRKLNPEQREKSLQRYVNGLLKFMESTDSEVSEKQLKQIRAFGSKYLNAEFKTGVELTSSFKFLMSSTLMMTNWCSGEWVGAPGWESLCGESIYNIAVDMCWAECLNPYTAEDCVVLVPCEDLED